MHLSCMSKRCLRVWSLEYLTDTAWGLLITCRSWNLHENRNSFTIMIKRTIGNKSCSRAKWEHKNFDGDLVHSKYHLMYCKQSIFSRFLLSVWHMHSTGQFLYWTIYFLVFLIKSHSSYHYVRSLMQWRNTSLNILDTRRVGLWLICGPVEANEISTLLQRSSYLSHVGSF